MAILVFTYIGILAGAPPAKPPPPAAVYFSRCGLAKRATAG